MILPFCYAVFGRVFSTAINDDFTLRVILNENAIAFRGVGHHNMGNRADELFVLYNRAAAHECVRVGTTVFRFALALFLPIIRIFTVLTQIMLIQ